jgi:Membrane-bound serine protease (ClpP class)
MPSNGRVLHRDRGISWSWERTRLPNLLDHLLHAATFGPTREVIEMVLLGVLLVLVGIAVLVLEAHLTTAGVLGVAGTLSTATGVGLILASTGAPLWVTIPIAALMAIAGMVTLMVIAREVIVAGSQEIQTGPEALIGQKAVVSSWSGREGHVTVAGVLWHAEPAYGWEDPLPAPGDTVVVSELDGLSVSVRRPHAWEVKPVWKPSSLSL